MKALPKMFVAGALLASPILGGETDSSKLPAPTLENLTQSPAKSIDEFAGQALYIEFFAFW